jgi:hypothetical protein
MDKRYAHHLWTKIRPVKPWYFLVLALLFTALAVVSMRHNYEQMVRLRNQVYAADAAGKGVNEALQNLRTYVGHHMNTNLSSGENAVYPPIQLTHTYNRLVVKKGQQTTGQNQQIYSAAQAYCEKKIPSGAGVLTRRADCVKNYLDQRGGPTIHVNPDLYKFDFYSPVWTPDVAGLSIVAAMFSGVTFVILLIVRRSVHLAAK